MNWIRKSKLVKVVASYLALSVILDLGLPVASFALTSGPSQPEFASFEPVATTNMIDPFTGSFTYNLPVMEVPGPNGGGYAVSLSYHSGVSVDQESSWCGLGWNINPGAINRQKQGIADDHKGAQTKFYSKAPKDRTVEWTKVRGVETYSYDFSLDRSYRFNNNRGFGRGLSLGVAPISGITSFGFDINNHGDYSVSAKINPLKMWKYYSKRLHKVRKNTKMLTDNGWMSYDKAKKLYKKMMKKNMKPHTFAGKFGKQVKLSVFGNGLFNDFRSPTSNPASKALATNVRFSTQFDPLIVHAGLEVGRGGAYTERSVEPTKVESGYGQMYLSEAGDAAQDYFVEKEAPYTHRDKMLPVPFAGKDMFSTTGEGVSGGFQLFHNKLGDYRPVYSKSSTVIANAGYEMAAGGDIGLVGLNGGGGYQYNEIGDWPNSNSGRSFSKQAQDPVTFAYAGDQGGQISYHGKDKYIAAGVERDAVFKDRVKPYISDSYYTGKIKKDIERTSGIEYRTLSEMNETLAAKDGGEVHYNALGKQQELVNSQFVDLDGNSDIQKNSIGQFKTINEAGMSYTYGLPVYAGEEWNMSYSTDYNSAPLHEGIVYRNDIANEIDVDALSSGEEDSDSDNDDLHNSRIKRINGTYQKEAYANTYLLTEITTPDYIDRTMNGPSRDDFGGWTKFNYRATYGASNKSNANDWYQWRFPYRGMSFNRGTLSDSRDDMGSFSMGKKEVYYMGSIETKTHKAFFVTNFTNISGEDVHPELVGSGELRNDSREALNHYDSQDPSQDEEVGDRSLEKLEKIVLFALDDNGQPVGDPVKVVRMEYDYSLCRNLFNNINYSKTPDTSSPLYEQSGKLTLKKLWFEYDGIKEIAPRPYEFDYGYKANDSYGAKVKQQYPGICAYGHVDGVSTNPTLDQNPDYDPVGSDAWGNHRGNGLERKRRMQNWVQQRDVEPDFDPAAWNLKGVKLPSGGEILVQYEQHDYTKIQDLRALVMTPIESLDKDFLTVKEKIEIDLDNLGVPGGSENEYAQIVYNWLKENHVFFKFLYKVEGDEVADIDDCDVEYIDGYFHAESHLKEGDNRTLVIEVEDKGYTTPTKVCRDYVQKNIFGKPIGQQCYSPGIEGFPFDPGEAVKWLGAKQGLKRFKPAKYCKSLSPQDSYLRLPIFGNKKGGGIRVKRIVMYDDGLEAGDDVMYGSEFVYENEDGLSSGVATNEPAGMREENALVGYLKKRADKWLGSKIISGRDKDQFEGPFGESLLPSPSIGYGRVVSKSIHTGQTSPGFVINEFLTAASPGAQMVVEHSKVYKDEDKVPLKWVPVVAAKVKIKYLAQGWVFKINDLHGKPSRVTSYRGNYIDGEPMSDYVQSSYTDYEYYEPGEKVSVLKMDGSIEKEAIGMQEDVAVEKMEMRDKTHQLNIQFDADVGIPLPVGSASLMPQYTDITQGMNRIVTSKVLRYTTQTKKVISMKDGVVTEAENLVFSDLNGSPLIVQTKDEYDNLKIRGTTHEGKIVNYKVPAAYAYQNMGLQSNNERFAIEGEFMLYDDCVVGVEQWLGAPNGEQVVLKNQFLNLQGDEAHMESHSTNRPEDADENPIAFPERWELLAAVYDGKLVDGDLIELSSGSNRAVFFISEIDLWDQQRMWLQPLSFAINEHPVDVYPVYNRLEVIKSGYTNQLSAVAASVTTYGEGHDGVESVFDKANGDSKLTAGTAGVLSAEVATYAEDWYDHQVALDYGYQYDIKNPHSYEIGAKGKWRAKSTFIFESDIVEGTASADKKIYEAGTYTDPLEGFMFQETRSDLYSTAAQNAPSSTGEMVNHPQNTGAWIELNKVLKYSPHGEPLEEQNKLGISSTAHFGYGDNVPTLVAQNAPYYSVEFSSFENSEEAFVSSEKAHAGKSSAKVVPNQTINVGEFETTTSIDGSTEMLVKMWVQGSKEAVSSINETFVTTLESGAGTVPVQWTQVAQVGDWILLESLVSTGLTNSFEYVDPASETGKGPGTRYHVHIENLGNEEIYVDDLRVQPNESSMTTYVYDKDNLRLMAQFDDQHFGLYYQYNAQGQLIRKLIETERGMKTVTETQYHTAQ